METQQAFLQVMECLEEKEVNQFLEGTLVYDEESTTELFDEIKEGDIIGCVTHVLNEGWVPAQWKVMEIPEGDDVLKCQTRYEPKREREIFYEDVSIGLVMGMCEILLRDDKPYGVSEEIDYIFRVPVYEMTEEEAAAHEAAKEEAKPRVIPILRK